MLWSPGEEMFVYFESIKQEIKRRLIYECRCDERLKTKTEESTRLTYTGFVYYESIKRELKHWVVKGCLL